MTTFLLSKINTDTHYTYIRIFQNNNTVIMEQKSTGFCYSTEGIYELTTAASQAVT